MGRVRLNRIPSAKDQHEAWRVLPQPLPQARQKLGGFRNEKQRFSPEAQRAGPAMRRALGKARTAELAPTIDEIKRSGVMALAGIAGELTARGIPTASGKPTWAQVQVSRVLARLQANTAVLVQR